jgi:uncharacterized membrane protein
MTRERYSMILPAGILIFVAAGLVLGLLVPSLTTAFYLISSVVGGAAIVVIDRIARRSVPEPVNDERLQMIAERSSWITFRIASIVIFIAGFILIYAFPAVEGLKLVGIGAVSAIALQGLVFGITAAVMRRSR